jgi:hypothetical protein
MRGFKFAVLLMLPLVVSISLATQVLHGGSGGIEGLVVDQANMPIAMASMQVCDTMRGGCVSVLSRSSGFYRIIGLAAGRYSLWAEANRHTSEWMPMIYVEEGQITRQDIQLVREIPTLDRAQ